MPAHQLVRYKSDKTTFEVTVKPKTVPLFRKGKLGLDQTLLSTEIFRDVSTAETASDSELQSAFDTTNKTQVLQKILTDGDYQLSTEERKEMTEKKRKEIINYVHKYYIDPTTKKPHPVQRIENALERVRFTVDFKKTAEVQAKALVPKLIDQIPLKKSTIEATLSLSHQHMGKCMGIVQQYCKISAEKYTGQGVQYSISIIPGDFDVFLKLLNDQTKGEYELSMASSASVDAAPEQSPSNKKKGRGKGKKGKRHKK